MKNWRFVFVLYFFSCSWLHAAADPLAKVARELADGVYKNGKLKVAVLAVPHHDNHWSDGPYQVSQALTIHLVQDKRLRILERNQVVQLLEELRISETGLIDPKSAKKIGDLLGAEVLITGTLIDLDAQRCEINARALLADGGRVIAASRAIIPRSWDGVERIEGNVR